MESAVINARVPVAKRDAAKGILQSLGKTPTDLINGAYDYLLSEGKLPAARQVSSSAEEKQKRMDVFRSFVRDSSFSVDWGSDADMSYKDLLAQAREEKYESLA